MAVCSGGWLMKGNVCSSWAAVVPCPVVHVSRFLAASTLKPIKSASVLLLAHCDSKMEGGQDHGHLHVTSAPSPKPKQWAAARVLGHAVNSFQTDLEERPGGMAEFFWNLQGLLEAGREDVGLPAGLEDFHLRIMNEEESGSGWYALILFSNGRSKLWGPVSASRCMSCDLDCPLLVGCVGDVPESVLNSKKRVLRSNFTLLRESTYSRSWLDAKAREKIIVTPKRHELSALNLSHDEVQDLFQLGIEQLANLGFHNFQSMVLNHGMMQNHAHLHLKISVTPSCTRDEKFRTRSPTDNTWFVDWMHHTGRADLANKLRTLKEFKKSLWMHRQALKLSQRWRNR